MERKIKKAGVIGAGVMGATIAAQLANVGIETVLIDIVPPSLSGDDEKNGLTRESPAFRNKFSIKGVEGALKSKPASFYIPENAKWIRTGNLEDHLDWLKAVDWVIEVVVERLDIKQKVFERLETVLGPETLVSSNTSGIPAKALCEGRSESFRKHFVITHFFNPPRYMKLLEIVPGPDTLPEVVSTLARVCERIVGKGIVYAKDTPNFIANRIGTYSMFSVIRTMMELGLTFEAVDQLTGPVIGNPKSASFRTADLVGLDTLLHVAANVYEGASGDEDRETFVPPAFMKEMVTKGILGDKTRQGFYKKTKDAKGKKTVLSLDPATLTYRPQEKAKFPSLEAAKSAPSLKDKLRGLFYAEDLAGRFTFKTTTEGLLYAAKRIPEIADDIVNVDRAMQWGFARKMGPFETWDALGVKKSVARMEKAGYGIPLWVKEMLDSGKESFYKKEAGVQYYYDPGTKDYREVPTDPDILLLPSLKERQRLVAGNSGASLVDLGDGIACLEFHTKMNALGEDIIAMIHKSAEIVSRDFEGLVIANHGENFSVGANLAMILFTAQEEEWDDLEWAVKGLQDALMKLKYLDKPVVAAPAGMALGGGCEVCLAADRVRYAAETYMGLVEVGVGVLPAGGGCKELLLRNTEHLFEVPKGGIYPKQIELMPFVARAFEAIAMARVATSGPEAVKMGFLRSSDSMTVNRDFLISDAKRTVQAMNLEGYRPRKPRDDIRVPGENTLAMIKLALWTMRSSNFITDHDVTVSTKVAHVLCGGAVQADTLVSEQYLLDLEREAFVSLCGDPKTQARMQHMLTTGKPLRN